MSQELINKSLHNQELKKLEKLNISAEEFKKHKAEIKITKGSGRGGTLNIVSPNLVNTHNFFDEPESRYIITKLNTTKNIHVINIYAPASGNKENNEFFKSLHKHLKKHKTGPNSL